MTPQAKPASQYTLVIAVGEWGRSVRSSHFYQLIIGTFWSVTRSQINLRRMFSRSLITNSKSEKTYVENRHEECHQAWPKIIFFVNTDSFSRSTLEPDFFMKNHQNHFCTEIVQSGYLFPATQFIPKKWYSNGIGGSLFLQFWGNFCLLELIWKCKLSLIDAKCARFFITFEWEVQEYFTGIQAVCKKLRANRLKCVNK